MFGLGLVKCKKFSTKFITILNMVQEERFVICMSEKLEFQENPFVLTTRFMTVFHCAL